LISQISPRVHIVVIGNDGNIYESQKYSEYLAMPSHNIQSVAYGNSLLDILTQEAYLTENLGLRQILTNNPYADATRLIGNLAEALVVKYCNKNLEINRTLARYARFGEREHKNLDNYIALGTASKLTQQNYLQHYQPNDTQRDVIWVDKFDNARQLACIGGTGSSSKPAGLQIKASNDGLKYVLPKISDYFYPILYFDIGDDWHIVKSSLVANGINATLIHPDEIASEIKQTLKGYFNLVVSIINGTLTIQRLIEMANYNGDSTLLAGIAASDISEARKIILPG
jgi:hypothetical protein